MFRIIATNADGSSYETWHSKLSKYRVGPDPDAQALDTARYLKVLSENANALKTGQTFKLVFEPTV